MNRDKLLQWVNAEANKALKDLIGAADINDQLNLQNAGGRSYLMSELRTRIMRGDFD